MEQTNISFIQEPWVRGNKIHGFGQLHARLFYCRTGAKPRAAIHVSNGINAMILNQFTNDDLAVVRVCRDSKDGGDFIVTSVYMPYDAVAPHPGPSYARVVDYCRLESIPLLTGADANAHHLIWGSTDTNRRGEELIDYLVTTDLMILNKGSKPTFVNAVRSECIDITLASCKLVDRIHSWRVTDEETFSDHKLIKFCLRGSFPAREPYRNPRKTDWDRYRRILSEKLSGTVYQERFFTIDSLEKANREITESMISAYQAACPLIAPKPLYKNAPWSKDLDEKKKKLRKAWNLAGKKGADQEKCKEKYSDLLKDYKKSQAELKEKFKVKFFEEADSIPAFARVHKILAKDPAN